MPTPSPEGHKKLSIVVFSGAFEKVHYALVMASGALATDRASTLFFTMDAIKALTTHEDHLGWQTMTTTDGGQALDRDFEFQSSGIGTFEELLSACHALGVRIMVCEMGLKAMGLTRDDLRDDIQIQEGGVVSFLNDAETDAHIIFI